MKEKLKMFNIEVDDIETINFENGLIQQIARKYADEYDLKRLELVLNGNIITAKDKFTGINSYMGMRISLEPLEKDISFIIRPTNKPTYEQLQQENIKLKSTLKEIREYINDNSHYYSCDDGDVGFVIEEDKEETFCKDLLEIIDKGIGEDK